MSNLEKLTKHDLQLYHLNYQFNYDFIVCQCNTRSGLSNSSWVIIKLKNIYYSIQFQFKNTTLFL